MCVALLTPAHKPLSFLFFASLQFLKHTVNALKERFYSEVKLIIGMEWNDANQYLPNLLSSWFFQRDCDCGLVALTNEGKKRKKKEGETMLEYIYIQREKKNEKSSLKSYSCMVLIASRVESNFVAFKVLQVKHVTS